MVSAVLPAWLPLPLTFISPGARWLTKTAIRPNKICARDENVSAGLLVFFSTKMIYKRGQTFRRLRSLRSCKRKVTGSFLIWPQLFVDVFLGELINGKKHFHPKCVSYYMWLQPPFFSWNDPGYREFCFLWAPWSFEQLTKTGPRCQTCCSTAKHPFLAISREGRKTYRFQFHWASSALGAIQQSQHIVVPGCCFLQRNEKMHFPVWGCYSKIDAKPTGNRFTLW